MSIVRAVSLDSGSTVFVEVHDRTVEGRAERAGVATGVAKTFEAAWNSVFPVIHSLSKSMASCAANEAEIKFGVKLGSDLNAFIASATGEANFEVTLVWKSNPTNSTATR
jgi:hypothetical protein